MNDTPSSNKTVCDFKCCAPRVCQKLRKRWLWTLCLGIAGLLQTMMVVGVLRTVLTTLEIRFGLTSKESGLIILFYEIGGVLILLHVSYYGETFRRPRIVSYGVMIFALGSCLFIVPHLLVETHQPIDSKTEILCVHEPNRTRTNICENVHSTQRPLSNYKWLFWLSSFLLGIGACPLYTLGITYMDDIVEEKSAPLYFAVVYAITSVGTPIGFIASSTCLRMFVNVEASSEGLDPDRPFWVGAWWITPAVISGLAALAAVPLYGFPREMPKADNSLESTQSATLYEINIYELNMAFMDNFVPIIRNWTFIFVTASGIMEYLLLVGLAGFVRLFYTANFGVSQTSASHLIGVILLPMSTLGLILSGLFVKHVKMSLQRLLKIIVIVNFISIPAFASFLLTCGHKDDKGKWAGIDRPYFNESFTFNLNHRCNKRCNCLRLNSHYLPVCGTNHVNYFSPCFAGCTQETDKGFSNCSCLPQAIGNLRHQSRTLKGTCTKSCPNLRYFNILFAFTLFISYSLWLPSLIVTLRLFPYEQKSLALGIRWLSIRVIGMVPAPLALAYFFDFACVLYGESCSGKGSCVQHDVTLLRKVFFLVAIVLKCASVLALFFAAVIQMDNRFVSLSITSSTGTLSRRSEDA